MSSRFGAASQRDLPMWGGSEAGSMGGGTTHRISLGEQREGAGFGIRVPPPAQLTPAQDSGDCLGPQPGSTSPVTLLCKAVCLSFPISKKGRVLTSQSIAVRIK